MTTWIAARKTFRVASPENAAAAHAGIRPENITPVAAGKGQINGVIDVVEYLGADTFLVMNCGALGRVTVRITGENDLETGAEIGLAFDVEKMHYFDENGKAIR